MPQQLIFLGDAANDRNGTKWRAGGQIINENFTELYGLVGADDAIYVSQESDFPVQDATTITLSVDTPYIPTASFTVTKQFKPLDGSSLIGRSIDAHEITSTKSGAMFDGADVNFLIANLSISAEATSQAFNFIDNVGASKKFICNTVQLNQGVKWGTFEKMQLIEIFNSNAPASTDIANGIEVIGATTLVSIDRFALVSTSASFKGVNLGTSVVTIPEMSNLFFVAPAGAKGVSGLANSGNVPAGSLGMLIGSEFQGGMDALENIEHSDDGWQMENNFPIPDSHDIADVFLTGGSETITVANADEWYEIGIPTSPVVWSNDIAERFTVGTDGVITYTGRRDITVRISGRATVEKTGGGSNVLECRIAKNWDGTVTDSGLEKSRAQTENASPTTIPVGALVPLTNGDNLRPIFSNVNGTSDIIADVSSLEVSGI